MIYLFQTGLVREQRDVVSQRLPPLHGVFASRRWGRGGQSSNNPSSTSMHLSCEISRPWGPAPPPSTYRIYTLMVFYFCKDIRLNVSHTEVQCWSSSFITSQWTEVRHSHTTGQNPLSTETEVSDTIWVQFWKLSFHPSSGRSRPLHTAKGPSWVGGAGRVQTAHTFLLSHLTSPFRSGDKTCSISFGGFLTNCPQTEDATWWELRYFKLTTKKFSYFQVLSKST